MAASIRLNKFTKDHVINVELSREFRIRDGIAAFFISIAAHILGCSADIKWTKRLDESLSKEAFAKAKAGMSSKKVDLTDCVVSKSGNIQENGNT